MAKQISPLLDYWLSSITLTCKSSGYFSSLTFGYSNRQGG